MYRDEEGVQMETVNLDFTEPYVLQIVPVLSNEIAISWETLSEEAQEKVLSCVRFLDLAEGREFCKQQLVFWRRRRWQSWGKYQTGGRWTEKIPPRQSGLTQGLSIQQGVFSLPRNWQEKCWPTNFQVSSGYYLTTRMLGLILAQLNGKVTGLEIRRPGSLALIWLPTSFISM